METNQAPEELEPLLGPFVIVPAGNVRALTIRNLAVGNAATETACELLPSAL
jgi:hypothetical protein